AVTAWPRRAQRGCSCRRWRSSCAPPMRWRTCCGRQWRSSLGVMGNLRVRELSPWAGVEVTGADFSQPLSADDASQLGELFHQYHLVLLRDVELEGEDQ